MATTEHIQSILDRMPHEPGVYQHFDADGKLLYIGKAKNLKKRVASYFTKQDHNGKTRLLVKKIRDVQWIVTASEADALLLENNMIKEHKPIYNIQLKDDKTYPFIVLKKERFPRIFPTRQVRKDGSEYFGPYSNVKGMHAVLDLCKKLYPIRTCSLALTEDNISKGKFRVCLEYHIGNCMGPCVGKQTEEAYAESIAAIRHVLKGNLGEVKSALKTAMMAAAEDLRFEEAERLKLKLLAVDKFQAKSTVVHPTISDVEVYGVVTDAKSAFVNFMRIHNGAVVQGQTLEFRRRLDESDVEILSAAIPQIRDRFNVASRTVLAQAEVEVIGAECLVPQRGDKKKLLDLSLRNAQFAMRDRHAQLEQVDPDAAKDRLMETMMHDLRLKEHPVHMECFDNSNIHGTNPASACVVFRNGKPAKRDYRKFNIRTVEGPDDFASMKEAVYRRYKRLRDEGESLPQMVVIDGGKGQLSHAMEAIDELGLRGQIAFVGIAKRLEELYFPGDSVPIYLDKRSPTLRVVQHMRDEAHRFSLAHHRKRRSKAFLHSELDDIPGVGPKTRQALMTAFGDVRAISEASEKALLDVVNLKVARAVRVHFHGSKA